MKKNNPSLKIVSAICATSGVGVAGYFTYTKVIPYVKKMSVSSGDSNGNLNVSDVLLGVKEMIENNLDLSQVSNLENGEAPSSDNLSPPVQPEVNQVTTSDNKEGEKSTATEEEIKSNPPADSTKTQSAPKNNDAQQQQQQNTPNSPEKIDDDYVEVGELEDDEGKAELEEITKGKSDDEIDILSFLQKAFEISQKTLFQNNQHQTQKTTFEELKKTLLSNNQT